MRAVIALLLVVLVLVLGTPVVLHVTQRGHDVLPFSIAETFPPGKPVVRGEVFATTLVALVEHELRGATGWRPNDFVLWGPRVLADNNSNRQLGIIAAVRESTRVMKDHLTKVSSTEYDANLVRADTAFRNDMTKLWLPSAESKLKEGVEALRAYVEGLHTDPPRSKPITGRNVELIRLLQSWGDLLGDSHGTLFKDTEPDGSSVSMTHTRLLLSRAGRRPRDRSPGRGRRPRVRGRLREPAGAAPAPERRRRGARARGCDEAARRARRRSRGIPREPSPEPRCCDRRRAPEDLLDPRRALARQHDRRRWPGLTLGRDTATRRACGSPSRS